MEWYYILLIVLAAILLLTFIFSLIVFKEAYGRDKKELNPDKLKEPWLTYYKEMTEVVQKFEELNPETLTLNCSDGKKRRGYFLRSNDSDVLVVFSHGWKSSGKENFGITGEYALKQKYNILVVDHLGHGESDSNYLGYGIKDYYALIEWVDLISKKENKEFKVFMHGVSMGANTCLLCADKKVKGLKGIIADCGFTNGWVEICHVFKSKYHMPAFPFMYFTSLYCKLFLKMDLRKLSTLDTVSNSNVAIYYIHGDQDDFVPTHMTIENEKVTKAPHQLWISKGCKHARTVHEYRDEYLNTIVAFIEKYKVE